MIMSAQNKYIKLYRSLEQKKVRDESGLVPLEGLRLVSDVLSSGILPEVVILREGQVIDDFPFLRAPNGDTVIITVEEKLFVRTAFTTSPQGILAIVKNPLHTLSDVLTGDLPLILVADGIQDPGNLGTMLRSAAAAGADGAVLLPGTVDASNPKAVRAAMGASFFLPVAECSHEELIQEMDQRGIRLVTTGAVGSVPYDQFDWRTPTAVVVGNEGAGISPQLAQATDAVVSIPMASCVESLNAAIAISVILFEASRCRRRLA
jgi:TrmH family RNA methyltransferase